jgi:hypothetical protein
MKDSSSRQESGALPANARYAFSLPPLPPYFLLSSSSPYFLLSSSSPYFLFLLLFGLHKTGMGNTTGKSDLQTVRE